MSQGIALQFKQKYGRVATLRAQVRQVGGCAVIKDGSRWLFYLVTKPRYFLKPTYHTLELALISLKQHLLDMQITELAIPGFMACHRDRLNWYRVKQLLYKVFSNVDLTIYIVYFTWRSWESIVGQGGCYIILNQPLTDRQRTMHVRAQQSILVHHLTTTSCSIKNLMLSWIEFFVSVKYNSAMKNCILFFFGPCLVLWWDFHLMSEERNSPRMYKLYSLGGTS